MGELEGRRNSWGYVEGGMGRVSAAIAAAAQSHGAEITTDTVSLQYYCTLKTNTLYNMKLCQIHSPLLSYIFIIFTNTMVMPCVRLLVRYWWRMGRQLVYGWKMTVN